MSICPHMGRIEVGEKWDIGLDFDIIAHAPVLDTSHRSHGARGLAVMYVVES